MHRCSGREGQGSDPRAQIHRIQDGWCWTRRRKSQVSAGGAAEAERRKSFGKEFLTVEFQVGEECGRETSIDHSKCKTDTWTSSGLKTHLWHWQHRDGGALWEWAL